MITRKKSGRAFYRILCTLLSVVLIMTVINVALLIYMRDSSIDMRLRSLSMEMQNGVDLMDDFLQGALDLYGSLSSYGKLARLGVDNQLNLEQTHFAHSAICERLSAYLISADYASEAYVYLYNRDYIMMSGNSMGGVTELTTYFNNRFTGDSDSFAALLNRRYSFDLVKWPFEPRRGVSVSVDARLAIAQTIYFERRAIGTLVITLDGDALIGTVGKYIAINGSHVALLFDGAIMASDGFDFDAVELPKGEYSEYMPGLGIVARRASDKISMLEYLVLESESEIMPGFARMMMTASCVLAAVAVLMTIMAVVASSRLYLPLRMLLGELKGEVSARTDEGTLLLEAIRAINSENSSIRSALDTSAPLVRDALLYHLLRGNRGEERALMDRYLPAAGAQRCFYAIVITIVFDVKDAERAYEEGAASILARIERDIASLIISAVKTGELEHTLVTYPLTAEQYAAASGAVASACEELGREHPDTLILAGAGEGVMHIERIAVSFRQARRALLTRPITRCHALVRREDCAQPGEYLPIDMEKTLGALLSGGDAAGAWKYIENILSRNRESDISAQSYVKVAYIINMVLLRAAAPGGRDADMIEIHPAHVLIRPEHLDSILRDNLTLMMSRRDAVDTDIDRVTAYMAEHFAAGINLSSTAEHFGYNPNYFSRWFKQRMGVNFTDHLNRLKIDCACRLLRVSGMSVREAGERSGFGSQSQFITTFERLVGTTPGAYKKRARE